MRASRSALALVLSAALLVVGVLLLLGSGATQEYGWFAYSPLESDRPRLPTILLVTPSVVVGAVAVWLATLLVAGVVGHHLARRRRDAA